MAHFIKRTQLGGAINIYRTFSGKPTEALVAAFPPSLEGRLGYSVFVSGLAERGLSLFSRDEGNWIVGSINQLDTEPAA